MRFHGLVEEVFHGRTSIRVLRVLLRYPTKEFTGREMARLSGTAPSKAIQELNRLQGHGVVERRTVGATQLWRAVPGHYALESAAPVFRAEDRAMAELGKVLAAGLRDPGVREAVLFGSVARGQEVASSDVDLLIVVQDAHARERIEPALARLRERVTRRFGNLLHAVVFTEAEARRAPHRGLLERARTEGIPVRQGRERARHAR